MFVHSVYEPDSVQLNLFAHICLMENYQRHRQEDLIWHVGSCCSCDPGALMEDKLPGLSPSVLTFRITL